MNLLKKFRISQKFEANVRYISLHLLKANRKFYLEYLLIFSLFTHLIKLFVKFFYQFFIEKFYMHKRNFNIYILPKY